MKTVICYVCVTNGARTTDFASRFVATGHSHPPNADNDLLVICNGGPLKTEQNLLFSEMNAKFWPHPNDPGWDISAYIDAAHGPCKDYDMMVCLGESVYFHRAGWLKRIQETWNVFGPGMYGPFGTNVVRTHLQTTAFVTSPKLLREYPVKVNCKAERYRFEHGKDSFMRRLKAQRYPVLLVTWDGAYTPKSFRFPPNILWRGDQSNCLMWANHADHYRDANEERKRNWSKSADRPYR